MMIAKVLASLILGGIVLVAGGAAAIAYADYSLLDCPGANQCSDALTVMQIGTAIAFVAGAALAAIAFSTFKRIRKGEDTDA